MQICNLYMCDANKMFSFFKFYVVHLFRKKARVSSIGKRFLFPESNDPHKAANSESNEGSDNSTVVIWVCPFNKKKN